MLNYSYVFYFIQWTIAKEMTYFLFGAWGRRSAVILLENIDSLAQDRGKPIANALEFPQSALNQFWF